MTYENQEINEEEEGDLITISESLFDQLCQDSDDLELILYGEEDEDAYAYEEDEEDEDEDEDLLEDE